MKTVSEPTWYLYVVENRLGQWYTGITTDPVRRLRQHSGFIVGGARALKGKGPLHFKAIYKLSDRRNASVVEAWFKKQSRKIKQAIINEAMGFPAPHMIEKLPTKTVLQLQSDARVC